MKYFIEVYWTDGKIDKFHVDSLTPFEYGTRIYLYHIGQYPLVINTDAIKYILPIIEK